MKVFTILNCLNTFLFNIWLSFTTLSLWVNPHWKKVDLLTLSVWQEGYMCFNLKRVFLTENHFFHHKNGQIKLVIAYGNYTQIMSQISKTYVFSSISCGTPHFVRTNFHSMLLHQHDLYDNFSIILYICIV